MKHLNIIFLLVILSVSACNKDEDQAEPEVPVEQPEVFTTVRLTFTDTEPIGGIYETFALLHKDLDGSGGNDPVITADTVPTGRYFDVSIELWNESGSPAVDLTSQIRSEAVQHQFFFDTGDLAISISNLENDVNGKPVGLSFNAQTLAASEGDLKITLRHDLDKDAEGVAGGDITNAGGTTDLEVIIPVILD